MMKMFRILLPLLLMVLAGCQSTHIKDRVYKISASHVELGAVGYAYSPDNLRHKFDIKAIPVLENKVRLEVQLLPFTAEINSIYLARMKEKGLEPAIKYSDSLPKKPVYVTVSLLDAATFTAALNSPVNKELYQYLVQTKNTSMITGLALAPQESLIEKINTADTFYLVYNQDGKYAVACYRDGKRTGIIDLGASEVLAYTTGRFCWFEDERGRWKIGDIVKSTDVCRGKMKPEVKDKEEVNLFKL